MNVAILVDERRAVGRVAVDEREIDGVIDGRLLHRAEQVRQGREASCR